MEKFLHFQDSVPCKIRAKRGCATHPRSIAERVRIPCCNPDQIPSNNFKFHHIYLIRDQVKCYQTIIIHACTSKQTWKYAKHIQLGDFCSLSCLYKFGHFIKRTIKGKLLSGEKNPDQ